MTFLEKIRGYKRILAAIVGLIMAVLADVVGLDNTALIVIEGILGTFILGQSYTDANGYNPSRYEETGERIEVQEVQTVQA